MNGVRLYLDKIHGTLPMNRCVKYFEHLEHARMNMIYLGIGKYEGYMIRVSNKYTIMVKHRVYK